MGELFEYYMNNLPHTLKEYSPGAMLVKEEDIKLVEKGEDKAKHHWLKLQDGTLQNMQEGMYEELSEDQKFYKLYSVITE